MLWLFNCGEKRIRASDQDFGRFISGACDTVEELKDELVPKEVRRRL